MKKNFKDVFFLKEIFKWITLSLAVGLTVGIITSYFVKLVNMCFSYTSSFKYYYFLAPLAFFASSFAVNKFCIAAKGHGTEKAIEAFHKNSGRMSIIVVPFKMLTALVTVVFGGSVGLEGPSTQVGEGIASSISDLFKLSPRDRKILAVCGIGAGFTAVFNAPIGGALYAVEVLYIGKLSYNLLFPALISAITSSLVAKAVGLKQVSCGIQLSSVSPQNIIGMIIFGIAIGIVSVLFIFILNKYSKTIHKIKKHPYLIPFIGGVIYIILILATGQSMCLGTGSPYISALANGTKNADFYTFLVKMFSTSITLGSGGSGGILTPMLFIGASFGNVFARVLGQNAAVYTAVGMTGFLGACSNTPIAATIMAFEIFGSNAGFCAAVACITAYIVSGISSVYPTQVVAK